MIFNLLKVYLIWFLKLILSRFGGRLLIYKNILLIIIFGLFMIILLVCGMFNKEMVGIDNWEYY